MSNKPPATTAKSDSKSALTPKLRFPEFRDAAGWDERPFSYLYAFESTNTFSRDMLNYEAGTVRNIHYGDIHTRFQALFDINREIVPFVNPTESLDNLDPDAFCTEGDMIFADASEDLADVGKCIEIIALGGNRVLSGTHTLLARRKGAQLIVGFGGHLFRSSRIREQIKREAQGSKVFGISAGRLSNIKVCFPADKSEQQKISECLSSVDELIAAQAWKLGALKTHKKGLMQQLFPREGETQPRLRFPEFQDAGEWVERPFGDLLDDIIDFRGRTPTKLGMEWGGGNITSLSANNVKNGFIDYKAECNLGSEELYSRWMGDVNLEKEDIIFTMEAPLGNALLLPDSGKYILSQRVVAFKTKVEVLNPFLVQIIWGEEFQNEISKRATGSTAKGINQGALKTVPVRLPEIDEQQRIADCLTSLDNLIDAQTQNLDALKTHKIGLMQQLFPSPEEVEA